MTRRLCAYMLALTLNFALVGCQQPAGNMQDLSGPPPRPAELEKLDAWVGNWTGTGELTMYTPEGEQKMTTTGTEKASWVCDNRFLMSTYEWSMGEEGKYTGYSFMTYDPDEKEYQSWSFSNFGSAGHGEMKWDEAAGLWRMEGREKKPDGSVSIGEGTVKMSADGSTNEWTYTEWENAWKFKKTMEVTGTSKKQ